jgi:hypothetical protein
MATLLLWVLIRETAVSGRTVAAAAETRIDPIAPGAPPVLAFRFIEGAQRGRFQSLDLILDDAGH